MMLQESKQQNVSKPRHSTNSNRRRKATIDGRALHLFTACKSRAKGKFEINITKEWIEYRLKTQSGCALTGIEFSYTPAQFGFRTNPLAPSIDRIDSTKGYTRENCRIVLSCVNMMLNEFGLEAFEVIAIQYLLFSKKDLSSYDRAVLMNIQNKALGR